MVGTALAHSLGSPHGETAHQTRLDRHAITPSPRPSVQDLCSEYYRRHAHNSAQTNPSALPRQTPDDESLPPSAWDPCRASPSMRCTQSSGMPRRFPRSDRRRRANPTNPSRRYCCIHRCTFLSATPWVRAIWARETPSSRHGRNRAKRSKARIRSCSETSPSNRPASVTALAPASSRGLGERQQLSGVD
jgi:hypothetical protein